MNAPASATLPVMARLLLLQAGWEPARLQAAGLAFALEPWLVRCWAGRPEELRAARARHAGCFNTHPYAAWLVAGALCALEAEAAALPASERSGVYRRIEATRGGVACSLAALYDSFFWSALRAASAVLGCAALFFGGPVIGFATLLLAFAVPSVAARWWGFRRGLAEADRAALALTRLPAHAWMRGLRLGVAGLAAAAAAAAVLAVTAQGDPDWRATVLLVAAGGLAMSLLRTPPAAQALVAWVFLTGVAVRVEGWR